MSEPQRRLPAELDDHPLGVLLFDDGETVVIGAIMQHIEDAGIHSGDSACVLPPYLIGEADMETMREQTIALAKALGVVGLINVQYAIKNGVVYVLEVNPRASRTIPFVSKAIGVQLASLAARVMMGEKLADIGFTEEVNPPYVSVKEAVFPFSKFPGVDPVLGPEMRSTGEVMGISSSFGASFAKAELAAANELPLDGAVLITVNDNDKSTVTPIARRFHEMGFEIFATAGTARYLRSRGVPSTPVLKIHEGRPSCLDLVVNRDIGLLINTPLGKHSQVDDYKLRQAAIVNRVSYTTTMSAASAASDAILALKSRKTAVKSLQEWQSQLTPVA
jgi:carbamoyl-phosphate synthase large subunit